MEKQKSGDSIIIGAGVWAILFTGIGIFDIVTKKNGYWIFLLLGGLAFIYLIYLLRKTKDNPNERYEDERKKFISEKSKNMSFDILFGIIVIFQFLISTGKIVINSDLVILILMVSALIIKFISYLVCRFKY